MKKVEIFLILFWYIIYLLQDALLRCSERGIAHGGR